MRPEREAPRISRQSRHNRRLWIMPNCRGTHSTARPGHASLGVTRPMPNSIFLWYIRYAVGCTTNCNRSADEVSLERMLSTCSESWLTSLRAGAPPSPVHRAPQKTGDRPVGWTWGAVWGRGGRKRASVLPAGQLATGPSCTRAKLLWRCLHGNCALGG